MTTHNRIELAITLLNILKQIEEFEGEAQAYKELGNDAAHSRKIADIAEWNEKADDVLKLLAP